MFAKKAKYIKMLILDTNKNLFSPLEDTLFLGFIVMHREMRM